MEIPVELLVRKFYKEIGLAKGLDLDMLTILNERVACSYPRRSGLVGKCNRFKIYLSSMEGRCAVFGVELLWGCFTFCKVSGVLNGHF